MYGEGETSLEISGLVSPQGMSDWNPSVSSEQPRHGFEMELVGAAASSSSSPLNFSTAALAREDTR
jgi:hypothetical protein